MKTGAAPPVTPETFGMDAMTRGCPGGTGSCFISHVRRVRPCGNLELACGNVRETRFPQPWRESRYFREFRDQSACQGKCGVCGCHRAAAAAGHEPTA